jgi:hypothetical protein
VSRSARVVVAPEVARVAAQAAGGAVVRAEAQAAGPEPAEGAAERAGPEEALGEEPGAKGAREEPEEQAGLAVGAALVAEGHAGQAAATTILTRIL